MSSSKPYAAVPVLLAMVLLVVLQEAASVSAATGKASYYSAPYVPSACFGFDPPPSDGLFAAGGDGNPNLWQNGQGCGKFYNIKCTGSGCKNSNTIRVKIIDRCPNGCLNRAFDLSETAFSKIANTAVGVITVTYSSSVNDMDVAVE